MNEVNCSTLKTFYGKTKQKHVLGEVIYSELWYSHSRMLVTLSTEKDWL